MLSLKASRRSCGLSFTVVFIFTDSNDSQPVVFSLVPEGQQKGDAHVAPTDFLTALATGVPATYLATRQKEKR